MPNYLIIRGGGHAPRFNDTKVILIQARQFLKKHPTPYRRHRQRLHFILWYYYDLSPAAIARLTRTAYNTVRADIDTEEILTQKSAKECDLLHDLYDYIIYNTKYLP